MRYAVLALLCLSLPVEARRPAQAPRPPQAPPAWAEVRESREVWVVSTAAVAPTTKAKRGKSCPCSPACTCGCNEGQPCTCGNPTTGRGLMRSEFIPAMMPTYSYPATPAFSGWSGGFGGGGSMRGGC